MSLLPVKIVCRACSRPLFRYGHTPEGHRFETRARRKWGASYERVNGTGRITADCGCGAHVVVKAETILRHAALGAREIPV